MPSLLNGQTDLAALATHVSHTALHIDTPQPSYFDFGTPIFDGSIDWHSSVHAHLATVLNYDLSGDALGLDGFVTSVFNVADVQAEATAAVNDPYGWAWLLKLDTTLRDLGYDNLAPAGEAYALRLAAHLDGRASVGSLDLGEGSYGDTYWMVANLHQWAVDTDDTLMEARAAGLFDAVVADSDITGEWGIADGDFFSAIGIATYAHVVLGESGGQLPMLLGVLDEALESGALEDLLASEGAALGSGVGYGHAPGVPISLGYGYWAAFTATQDPAFYAAYQDIMEWTESHADAMGDEIGAGHWLPNFAAFGISLPTDLVVVETPALVAALQAHGIDITPTISGEDTLVGDDDTDDVAVASYSLDGVDAQVFTVDPETGEVGYRDWFTPTYADAWDVNEDHVYEVTVIGRDGGGAIMSRAAFEMVVSETGILWRDAEVTQDPETAPDPDLIDPAPPAPEISAITFSLTGPDASLFVLDAATGTVAPQAWFVPSFDDAWDQNDDHIYEVTRISRDPDGNEVARDALELRVSADGATWHGETAQPDPDPSTDDAPITDETPTTDPAAGTTVFALDGPDAFLFEIDSPTGLVAPKDWFMPSHADPWDQDENQIYEIDVVQTNADGEELARATRLFEVREDSILRPLPTADDLQTLMSGNPAEALVEDPSDEDQTDMADLA